MITAILHLLFHYAPHHIHQISGGVCSPLHWSTPHPPQPPVTGRCPL